MGYSASGIGLVCSVALIAVFGVGADLQALEKKQRESKVERKEPAYKPPKAKPYSKPNRQRRKSSISVGAQKRSGPIRAQSKRVDSPAAKTRGSSSQPNKAYRSDAPIAVEALKAAEVRRRANKAVRARGRDLQQAAPNRKAADLEKASGYKRRSSDQAAAARPKDIPYSYKPDMKATPAEKGARRQRLYTNRKQGVDRGVAPDRRGRQFKPVEPKRVKARDLRERAGDLRRQDFKNQRERNRVAQAKRQKILKGNDKFRHKKYARYYGRGFGHRYRYYHGHSLSWYMRFERYRLWHDVWHDWHGRRIYRPSYIYMHGHYWFGYPMHSHYAHPCEFGYDFNGHHYHPHGAGIHDEDREYHDDDFAEEILAGVIGGLLVYTIID